MKDKLKFEIKGYKIWIWVIVVSFFFTFPGWNLIEVIVREGNKWFLFVWFFLAVWAGCLIGYSTKRD